MESINKFLSIILTFLFFISFTSCEYDSTVIEEFGDNYSIDEYYGNFSFKVITELWKYGEDRIYDTSYYDGFIKKFELPDNQVNLDNMDDTLEDPTQKITIKFKELLIITPRINLQGELIAKNQVHYHHEGKFSDLSTFDFKVTGLGGLGGGVNYYVKGVRK